MRKLCVVWMVASLAACSGSPEEIAQSDDEALAQCAERNEMILWSPNAPFAPILDELTPNLKCTHWYVGIPLSAGDKVNFHAGVKNEIAAVHARGTNFHAVAEFHWSSWRQWTEDNNKTWFDAGVEFRRRMDAAGFDLHYGDSDTWAIQELPSSLVHSDVASVPTEQVRQNAMNAIRGLYEGSNDNKTPNKKGIVYRVGSPHDYTNVGGMLTAKQRAKAFLMDNAFWQSMSQHVRWWADEVYADPLNACVPNTLTAIRARHINDYVFHLPELAEAGPPTVARSFFRKTFTPLLNGAWKAPLGYGRNDVPADAFIHHVSTEVYAVRAWQSQHPAYGNRLGFAWAPKPDTQAEKDRIPDIGQRIGRAVDDSFERGHGASYACSPSGAYTLCQCELNGAQFVETWGNIWATW